MKKRTEDRTLKKCPPRLEPLGQHVHAYCLPKKNRVEHITYQNIKGFL